MSPCKHTFIRCLYVAGVMLTIFNPPARWRLDQEFEKWQSKPTGER